MKKENQFFPLFSKNKSAFDKEQLLSLSKEQLYQLLILKDAVLEINNFILNFDNITNLFTLVLDKVMDAIGCSEYGSVLLLDDNNYLTMAVCKGYDEENMKNFKLHLYDSFFWKLSDHDLDKSQIVNDITYDFWDVTVRDFDNSPSTLIRSSLSTPIIINGKLFGLLNIDSIHNNIFGQTEVGILEYLKHQLEVGISNHLLYEKTIYLSRYDDLTKIYNRRYFEELFDNILYDKHLFKEFYVVMLDVDGLKQVNDTYGHLKGDLLLKTVVNKLKKHIFKPDIFARLAGDEFIAIFFDTTCDKITEEFDTILNDFKSEPVVFENGSFICDFSYGISKYPDHGTDYNSLIKHADSKMYKNKQKK